MLDRYPPNELTRLREKYSSVAFQGRTKKMPEEGIVAQYWFTNREEIKIRIAQPRRTKYVDVYEFEPYVLEAIRLGAAKIATPLTVSPTVYGKALIASLGGTSKGVGSGYQSVKIPRAERYGLPCWRGWLKFMDWEGRAPVRRAWTEGKRMKLLSSGMYAWMLLFSRGQETARLYYSQGEFESAWFRMRDIHKYLVAATEHADTNKWRESEIGGSGVVVPEEALAKQEPDQATNEPETIDTSTLDFGQDPTGPASWSGDLSQRYETENKE